MRWDRKRLKYSCDVNPPAPHVEDDQDVTFVPMEAVSERGGLDVSNTRRGSKVTSGYTGFVEGDVLVAKITPCFENGKGSIAEGLLNGVGYGTTELHVLRPRAACDRRWLFYVTQTHEFMGYGEGSMYGAGGQKRVPPEFVKDFRAPTPPLPTQRAIADFLDRKTAAIDDLIAKKERLLGLLAERRAALIHRAVTKGLDPTVPMKDSGVPWIGEIPAHWNVRRMRYLCRITTGGRDTQDAREDGPYPFFVRSDNVERIDTYSFDGEAVLTSGDGAGVGKIFHYYLGKLEFHQRVYLFYAFREVLGRYLYFFVKQHLATVVLEGTAKSTVDSIRRHMLTDFPIAFGPEDEQRAIVAFLDRTLDHMDQVVARIEQQVERLREYRQAVITAAVTGQLDLTAGEPAPAAEAVQPSLFEGAL